MRSLRDIRVYESVRCFQATVKRDPRGVYSVLGSAKRPNATQNQFSEGVLAPLVSRSKTQQQKKRTHKNKPGWGSLGKSKELSKKVRKRIQIAVAAIEREFGREKTRFCTFTLPSVLPRAFEALARYMAYALNRLRLMLNRLLGEFEYVAVWEYQKRGALHLHLVLGVENPNVLSKLSDRRGKIYWVRILDSIQEATGIDMYRGERGQNHRKNISGIRVRIEKVKKSLAAYMGKYLSKGRGNHAAKAEECTEYGKKRFFPVTRWAQYSSGIAPMIAKHTIVFFQGLIPAKNAIEAFDEALEMIIACREDLNVTLATPKTLYQLGFYGLLHGCNNETEALSFFDAIGEMFRGLSVQNLSISIDGTKTMLTRAYQRLHELNIQEMSRKKSIRDRLRYAESKDKENLSFSQCPISKALYGSLPMIL